jgi:hypothetical protein
MTINRAEEEMVTLAKEELLVSSYLLQSYYCCQVYEFKSVRLEQFNSVFALVLQQFDDMVIEDLPKGW